MSELARTLERFKTADASLLAKRSLLRRVDSKFVTRVSDVATILEGVTGHYGLVLAGGNHLASYRTLYYDTDDLQCFHDHRRGRRPRQKIRVRHYDDRSVSYLEVKTKRSEFISVKKRQAQEFGDSTLNAKGLEFLAKHIRIAPEALAPAANTDFMRATLVGLRLEERITIDIDLSLWRDDQKIDLNGIAILEVKQRRFSASSPILRAIADARCRAASASKYCAATALLSPGIRMNRLLPTLRLLERLRC